MKFLRSGNLVYIAIRKNASTFYTNFFQGQMGWKEDSFSNVDWDRDVIFSHISDPIARHIKGIAEIIDQSQFFKDLFNDPKFCNILGFSIADSHYVPIYTTLGPYVNKIDWILLDSPIRSEELTSKFLFKYNIPNELTYEQFRYRHSKSAEHKEIKEKIKYLIDFHKNNDTLNLLFNQDKILYKSVTEKFEKFINDSTKKYGSFILNPADSKDVWKNINWDEMSWLRNE